MSPKTPLAIALSYLLTSTVFAQYVPPTPGTLDKVEVRGFPLRYATNNPTSATKTDTPIQDIPQAVSVVSAQQIQEQDLQGMADLVRYVPGAGMAQGEGHRDAPVLRGNTSTGDFFTDGIRDDVQYYRDFYNIEQVEVLKGANAMIFGRGGGGGVINRVPKQANGVDTATLSLQAGSHDSYRVQGDFGAAASENLAWRITGMGEQSGSFRDGVQRRLSGINPSLAFGINDSTRAVVSIEVFNDDRNVDRGVPSYLGRPLDAPRNRFFGSADDSIANTDVDSFDLLLEHEGDGLIWRNRFRAANYDKFYQNVYPGAVNGNGSLVAISAYNNQTDRTNVFNQTDVLFDVVQGNSTHRILIGAEFGRQDTQNFRETGYFGASNSTVSSVWVDINNPRPTQPVYFRQSASDADNSGVADIAALYLQDQWHLGEHWQIIAGLRYDRFNMDFSNRRNGSRITTQDSQWSPRAGAIYQPNDALSFYGSYSQSFIPRSGDQLSSLTPSNASLKPEQFVNKELGAKWQLREGVFSTLAVYELDRNRVAVSDPQNPGQSLLLDAQRSRGVEWELSAKLSPELQLLAGYAYQEAVITKALSASIPAGTVLANVPEHSAYVWGRWDFNSRWALGLGINGQSSMYASTSNAVTLPGFMRVDTAVYYRQSEDLLWQLNIENLTDKRYYASAHNDNNISFGAPREAKLSVHIGF